MEFPDTVELFCFMCDFVAEYEWHRFVLANKITTRTRKSKLNIAEILTIILMYKFSGYRDFKTFYSRDLIVNHKNDFNLPSYTHLVNLHKKAMIPLLVLWNVLQGTGKGVYFVDSTSIKVCHIMRASCHKTFKNHAKKGKTTTGWFFGFKLHLVITEKGDITNAIITSGKKSDLSVLESLTQRITGKIFGDKGYISSPMFKSLYNRGLQLITRLRKNMKNKLMHTYDKILLSKRGLIESVICKLKRKFELEHTRHRSVCGWIINIFSSLSAYMLVPNKPSIVC